MEYNRLQALELNLYKSKIVELLVDTYFINFRIPRTEAVKLCLEKFNLLIDYVEKGSAIVIGVTSDHQLIAFIWLYIHELFDEKRLHVNQIVVDKEFRGQGIGRRLIKEAENQALNLDINVIDLSASEINKRVLDLYDSLGFEVERRYMKKKLQVNKE